MKAAETALSDVNKVIAELEQEENKLQKEVIDVKNELEKYQNLMKDSQSKIKHWKKEVGYMNLGSVLLKDLRKT